ncbi:MAG: hypothetical protein HY974_01150 [Candidatus Kerfeldbacteria bacterium]|nr:hypothetical protein [Candidatus Kerfeldbacteria bacterium]
MISLNLISPSQKEYLRYEYLYLHVRTVTVLLLTFTVIVSALFLAARLLLQDNFASILTTTTLVNDKNRNADREIKDLNKNLKEVKSVQADFIKWSTMLTNLHRAIPENIEVTYLNLEKKTKIFNLNGRALHRDDFLKLKASLSELPYLEELSSPLTNLLKRDDVDFQFTAKIKSSAINF